MEGFVDLFSEIREDGCYYRGHRVKDLGHYCDHRTALRAVLRIGVEAVFARVYVHRRQHRHHVLHDGTDNYQGLVSSMVV